MFEESGDLDEDMFMDVALGRVVARDLSSGSLLVSRIANYEYVRDPESEGKYAMGRCDDFLHIFSIFFRVVEFTSLGMALSERYWEVETNGELVVLWPGFWNPHESHESKPKPCG